MFLHVFCPFNNFFSIVLRIPSTLRCKSFVTYVVCKYFLLHSTLSLQLLNKLFHIAKVFYFDKDQFIDFFSSMGHVFGLMSKKHHEAVGPMLSPMIFSKSFIVYILNLNLWLILSWFLHKVWDGLRLILSVQFNLSQYHWLKRLSSAALPLNLCQKLVWCPSVGYFCVLCCFIDICIYWLT